MNNSTVYNGYIPPEAFKALERALTGVSHGEITLAIHVRDGKLARYTTSCSESFLLSEKEGRQPDGGAKHDK